MYLMGHTDATLTLAVYQQVLDMGKGELLKQTLGCTLAAARAVYNGEATAAEILGASREPAPGQSPRSRSNEPLATNGRAASQVFRSESGTELPKSLIVSVIRRRSSPRERFEFAGASDKRLKGLEPSTFCMASRRSSQLSYSRAI
jgi:hypothetical protein